MVLTRALACAVPVVASDIPGYRAVVEPEIGVLFPAGDHDALTEAVVDVLADEPARQRLGLAGRALVQERYAWETIAARLLEIYEDAVARVPVHA
jgi:glycosyltransferase involved in cell wall biosynthesis